MAQASTEKLEHTGPAENENGLSATERAVGKYARAALAKRNRAVCPEYQVMRGERVKMGESRTLARVRGIRARAWGAKGGLDSEGRQIPRRTGRASKKSLPRTSRRKHERVSGVVVRASASQLVDLGLIPLVESYQKTLKNGIRSFPAWR